MPYFSWISFKITIDLCCFMPKKKWVPFNDPWGLTPPFNCWPPGCRPLLNVSPPSSSLEGCTVGWGFPRFTGCPNLKLHRLPATLWYPIFRLKKIGLSTSNSFKQLFFQQGGPVLQIFLGWVDMFVLEMGNIQARIAKYTFGASKEHHPQSAEKSVTSHCLTPRLHRVSLWWPIAGAPAAFRQEATSKFLIRILICGDPDLDFEVATAASLSMTFLQLDDMLLLFCGRCWDAWPKTAWLIFQQ